MFEMVYGCWRERERREKRERDRWGGRWVRERERWGGRWGWRVRWMFGRPGGWRDSDE